MKSCWHEIECSKLLIEDENKENKCHLVSALYDYF